MYHRSAPAVHSTPTSATTSAASGGSRFSDPPFHQLDDADALRFELHRHLLGVWNYLKHYAPERERFTNYALEWFGSMPAKRESRRLMGDVIFTEHDCHTDRKWPDGVAYSGWWIDLHIKKGLLNPTAPGERENTDDNYKHWIRVAPFSVPLRSFYSRNVANLWMVGRCLSASHVGLGPNRVQLTVGAHGQAVGTAAAYALGHDLSPRQAADPAGAHVANIRQQLLRHDARLLGVRNSDPDDLALGARASASSSMPLDFGEPRRGERRRPAANRPTGGCRSTRRWARCCR